MKAFAVSGVPLIIRKIALIKSTFSFALVGASGNLISQIIFSCPVIHLHMGINSKVLLSTMRTMGRIKSMWILAGVSQDEKAYRATKKPGD